MSTTQQARTEAQPAARAAREMRRASRPWFWALRLHASYLVLFTIWTAWVSSAYPKFVEEAQRAVWPPSAPLGAWLERVVLLPLYRYDVIWYVGIAEHGYGWRAGDTAFHPLYPLLIAALGRIFGGQYLFAAWLISQVCCVAMLAMLYRLVELDWDAGTARRATLFMLGSPLGFAFLLPYTESLLLLSIVAALLAARRERWWLAGLAGACATLTKQPGAVVVLPLLWELWQQRRASGLGVWRLARRLVGLSPIALALAGWLVYRAARGDAAFDWRRPATLVEMLLVTPSYRDVWGEFFSWPWVNFGYTLDQLADRPYFYLVFNLFVMLTMLVLALYTILRQPRGYGLYSLALVVLNLSIVYPLWPYMGIIRRFTIIFPIFVQLAEWGRRRSVTALVLCCNALLWTYLVAAYVRNAFVP